MARGRRGAGCEGWKQADGHGVFLRPEPKDSTLAAMNSTPEAWITNRAARDADSEECSASHRECVEICVVGGPSTDAEVDLWHPAVFGGLKF